MSTPASGRIRRRGDAVTSLTRRLRRPNADRELRLAYLRKLEDLNRVGRLTDQELSDARRALLR